MLDVPQENSAEVCRDYGISICNIPVQSLGYSTESIIADLATAKTCR